MARQNIYGRDVPVMTRNHTGDLVQDTRTPLGVDDNPDSVSHSAYTITSYFRIRGSQSPFALRINSQTSRTAPEPPEALVV